MTGQLWTSLVTIIFLTFAFCEGGIKVCLTWSITNDELSLTCKVSDMRYLVQIIGPNKNIITKCHINDSPFSENKINCTKTSAKWSAKTELDITTVITTSKKMTNGEWRCTHGTGLDYAAVNVTVLAQPTMDAKHFSTFEVVAITLFSIIGAIVISGCFWVIRQKWSRCKNHGQPNQGTGNSSDGHQPNQGIEMAETDINQSKVPKIDGHPLNSAAGVDQDEEKAAQPPDSPPRQESEIGPLLSQPNAQLK